MKENWEEPGPPFDELDPEMATFGELLLRRAAGVNSVHIPRRTRENLLRSWRALRVVKCCDCGESECRSYVFSLALKPSQERNRPQTAAGELAIIANRNGEIVRVEAFAFNDCAPSRAHAYIANGNDWHVIRLAA